MAYLASFDPVTGKVDGYYPTHEIHYPELPPTECLIELTDEEWLHRIDHQHWYVEGGKMIAKMPPPPTLDELKERKRSELRMACRREIEKGYEDETVLDPHALFADCKHRLNAAIGEVNTAKSAGDLDAIVF